MRISDWSSDVCSSDLLRLEIDAAAVLFPVAVACRLRAVTTATDFAHRSGWQLPSRDDRFGFCVFPQQIRQGNRPGGRHGLGGYCFRLGRSHWRSASGKGYAGRSEERRGGTECVSKWRSRGAADHEKKKKK